MNKFASYLLLAAAAGWVGGLAVRRFIPHGVPPQAVSQQADPLQENPATLVRTFLPPPRSTDTLETLVALKETDLYARLALWLVDAGEADIAAFWSCLPKQEGDPYGIKELVFIHWTRLDPQAALAAAAGEDRSLAWLGWACDDPQAALAAARAAADPRAVESVVRGIGKCHPKWLREHFEEIPEDFRSVAIRASADAASGDNPLKALQFMTEARMRPDPKILKALARQDPWTALDWAKQFKGRMRDDESPVGVVLEIMASERPGDLKRLIAQTPSGFDKLRMEAAAFDHLIQTEPAAALEQAKSTTVPRNAAERYAAIGITLVRSDPEQACQLARNLLAVCPDALDPVVTIEYPGGSSDGGMSIPGVEEFISELMKQQPEKAMELCADVVRDFEKDGPFKQLVDQWAARDLAGYTGWLNRQTDSTVREIGAGIVVSRLQEDHHYEEAIEWATTLDKADEDRSGAVLEEWSSHDQAAASEWLESADLPAERKAELRAKFPED